MSASAALAYAVGTAVKGGLDVATPKYVEVALVVGAVVAVIGLMSFVPFLNPRSANHSNGR
jgi:hypothetical protein